jgi:hypothetical protein
VGVILGVQPMPPRSEPYRLVDGDVVESCDVCVIGSGAAGAVLAKELVEAGRSVVLLERGGYYEGRDMNQRELDMMPLLWKNSGFTFDDDLRVAIAQGAALGGSTIINDAVCFDAPARVRAEWRALGVTFTDAEWEEHTQRVNKTISVTPMADDELNRNNRLLRAGADALKLQDHHANKRNCVNCMQCGFCHLGCHYGTKQNMLVTYLHQALQAPDAQFRAYVNCYVDSIDRDDAGVVRGVGGQLCDAGGGTVHRIRVNAKAVVIAAGAVASSKLLLRNGIAASTAGRGVCLHPAPFVLGDFEDEVKGNQGVPMGYTVHDFGVTRASDATRQAHGWTGGEFLLESIFLPMMQFAMALPGDPEVHRALLQRFNHYAMAGVLVRDGNNGRVSLTQGGRASVRYKLGPKEVEVIAKGMELLARMWFALGARRLVTSHRDMPIVNNEAEMPRLLQLVRARPDRLVLGSAHPQSGNRMGRDPEASVVDADCRVHGFKNLFVCDASVFPTALGANPQVTVMTVASITAARIARDWKGTYAPLALSASQGDTCSLQQPWFCDRASMGRMFDGMETRRRAASLVNSPSETADPTNWSFDTATMTITNNLHWRGLFPRDHDPETTLLDYAGGFWKRFQPDGQGGVKGVTHPYEGPVFAANRASEQQLPGFGNVIVLEYTEPPFSAFHDVLKFVDDDTMLGKAFVGSPRPGGEMLTFAMGRRYPFGRMDEDDHARVYDRSAKPSFGAMLGLWEGRLVSDSAWSDPVFRFRYYKQGAKLLCDYVFGGSLAGTATVVDKGDRLEMDDGTGWHDELRLVKPELVVGKYYSPENLLARWMPDGMSFLHPDRARNSAYLPYVLRRLGDEGAFREYG